MKTQGLSKFCLAIAGILVIIGSAASAQVTDQDIPHFKVEPFWPKELPHNWIMGQVGGLAVDGQDHVWVLQRPRSATVDELGASENPPRSACCNETPAVLEFDAEGDVLRSWGGPGFVPDWPKSEHGLWVDKQGNVWIGGNASGDRQVLKFTSDGQLLLEIGHPSQEAKNNQDTKLLGQPAGIEVDDAAHEVYVADGYLNNRVVVYDSDTGQYKRGWGAYGIPLSKIANLPSQAGALTAPVTPPHSSDGPPAGQFGASVHCAHLSADGLVYVCDRSNDRIQVFTKAGKFLREFFVRPTTLGIGSVWDLSFSRDPRQKYLLVADGENNSVWILRRSDGGLVSSFGHNGRGAGYFHWVHQAAIDSKGNYYTGEADTGKRIQKFTPSQ